MHLGDTIAAIATGAGRSARGMIRLSGPATREVLARSVEPQPRAPGAHSIHFRIATSSGEAAVPALLALYFAPHSYTGEDSAEILLPGNPALLEGALDQFLTHDGIRRAEPGEFTARAYLNGRLTAEQAEGVQALIAARSDAELGASRRLLNGTLGREYRDIADELADSLALLEAGIDFTDQEVVTPISPAVLSARLDGLAARIDALVGPQRSREADAAEPVAVLVGPPNAGKSTLFNRLLDRPRAVVSDVPGTTRDAIAEPLHLPEGSAWGARSITLVDLAGLDAALAARGPIDAAAQSAARAAIARADIVLLCDPAGRFDEPGLDLSDKVILRIRTKADLPVPRAGGFGAASEIQPNSDPPSSSVFLCVQNLSVCALDGWGVAALRRALIDAAERVAQGRGAASAEESALLPRHRSALKGARAAIAQARVLLSEQDRRSHAQPELLAAILRRALDEAGQISGAISPDDVIGRIFATFCIGK